MTTGNVTWNIAPGRAFKTRNGVTATNATHTQIQACHHDMPNWIMDDTIIQLEVMLANAKAFFFVYLRIPRTNSRINVEHVCHPAVSIPPQLYEFVLSRRKRKCVDVQRDIVVSPPSPVLGDYRQQVLILEVPRLKEGQVGAAVLSERKGHTHGD